MKRQRDPRLEVIHILALRMLMKAYIFIFGLFSNNTKIQTASHSDFLIHLLI